MELFIYVLIAGIITSFLSYFRHKIRDILKFKGYDLKSTFFLKDYSLLKVIIKEEENLNKKVEYIRLAKKFIILYYLIYILIIALPFMLNWKLK
ncbi:MAG: hypothetical protein WCL51_17025 [Bacteroidota bacterium]